MGLLWNRKNRQERAIEIANKVASGKGFYGRTTRAFVGAEDFAKLQQSVGAMNAGIDAQRLLAMGVPTISAVVVSIRDTGKLVNFDPVVDLVLDLSGSEERLTLQTIVSKLQIPRPGDRVLLVNDPQSPGAYLYAGTA